MNEIMLKYHDLAVQVFRLHKVQRRGVDEDRGEVWIHQGGHLKV